MIKFEILLKNGKLFVKKKNNKIKATNKAVF